MWRSQLLITCLFQLHLCGILTNFGSSETGPDWQVTNKPNSSVSGTTTNVPYQFIQTLDYLTGMLRMKYNFSSGPFPQAIAHVLILQSTFSAEDPRADVYEDFKVELIVNITEGAQTIAYDSFFEVTYRYRQQKYVYIKVFYWRGPTASCSSQQVTLSGTLYGYRKFADDQYYLQVCSPTPTYLRTVFDITQLNKYALSRGILRVFDARRDVKVNVRAQGAGEVTYVHRVFYVERRQWTFSNHRSASGFGMVNEPPDYGSWTVVSCLNMSLPINGSVNGFISEQFGNGSNDPSGGNWIIAGYYQGSWKTPVNSSGIPVHINSEAKLNVNYSITPIRFINSGGCACFRMTYRDDFNPTTGWFINNGDYISKRVIIHIWYSEYYKSKQYAKSSNVVLLTLRYFGIDWELTLSQGNVYNFWAQSNITQLVDFDLLALVRYIRNKLNIFANRDFLVGVQTGFRYYNGATKIMVNDFSIKQVPPQEKRFKAVEEAEVVEMSLMSCIILLNQTHLCQQTALVTNSIETVLTIPTVGVLMRLSPLISLVDEYTFYLYHEGANYDKGAKFVIKICSSWTDNKWVPSFLQGVSQWITNLTQTITKTTIDNQTVSKPNKFQHFNKDNSFFNNLSDFFLISLPLNMFVFLSLMLLCWVLRQLSALQSVQSFLKPFTTMTFLWSSMFSDNMTYLSFHCFLQFYSFVPYSHGINAYPSCVFCVLVLFALLVTCFFGFVARISAANKFEIDHFQNGVLNSKNFYGVAMAGKFLSGFFHAYVDDPQERALGLFMISLCILAGVLHCSQAMDFKTYILFYILIYICKSLFNLQLYLQVLFPQVAFTINEQVSENSLILFISIFGVMLALYFLDNIIEMVEMLVSKLKQKRTDESTPRFSNEEKLNCKSLNQTQIKQIKIVDKPIKDSDFKCCQVEVVNLKLIESEKKASIVMKKGTRRVFKNKFLDIKQTKKHLNKFKKS